MPPLVSSFGVSSDHSTLKLTVEVPAKEHKYIRYKARKITSMGEDKFCDLVNGYDWSEIDRYESADTKTEFLHAKIEEFKDECFPFRMVKRRDDEDPWITQHIRGLSNKKRKEFGKNGYSLRWYELEKDVKNKIKNAKGAFYDREVEKICNNGNKKSLAYSALKNLKSAERPKAWSLSELHKNKEVHEIVELAADYFCEVSNSSEAVKYDAIDWTYDRPVYDITPEMVVERIKSTNRPNSSVPGDIPPRLMMRVVDVISVPVSKIFNLVPRTFMWPGLWKLEYQTIIPKKQNPTSFSETRNLSCTNFLSKILESFLIDSLRSEIQFSELQYGGLKGTGTDHFLAEVWNNVHESLDEQNKAVALMSLDFSKAFNRLNHQACLKKMAEKNASNQSIGMIYAFLNERCMKIRSGEITSTTRQLTGGSPQGTKLGNLLFCLTIDDIAYKEEGGTVIEENTTTPENAIPHQYRPMMSSTPISTMDDSLNPNPYGFRKKINVINDTIPVEPLREEEYRRAETWEVGYVDDLNVGETLNIEEGIRHMTTKKEKRTLRAAGCEDMHETIEKNGKRVGLALNSAKTQLLCFHSSKALEIECEVNIGGRLLRSGERLKILGFIFGSEPTPKYQVDSLIGKFNRAIWTIRHLVGAGLTKETIVRAYTSMVRPIVEFSSNIYGPMINKKQGSSIEKCQERVLKMIFGYEHDYTELLRRGGIESLESRRGKQFRKFCLKVAESGRFSRKWLPKYDEDTAANVRNRKVFIEFVAKTNRLYNSPIFAIRRQLNEMNL